MEIRKWKMGNKENGIIIFPIHFLQVKFIYPITN
jgi:hypothetical protein